jgi:tetratricopeptide (TPR) repeat protein/transcriptional regulator with XRE-family HTH domain
MRDTDVTGMFGEQVRAHRIRLGLTQEDLAAAARLSVRAISKLETGRTAPRLSTARLLADALGLTGTGRDDLTRLARLARLAAGEPVEPVHASAVAAVPAQLPADVSAFTGRLGQLAVLDELLARAVEQPTAVMICVVSGTAGVGKTALSVHWAHRVRDHFPDGQIYLNLRGYDPDQPMSATQALTRLLTTLGVAGRDIPLETDEQAARYRSTIAGRRILLLLDNAATIHQVRALLPGTAGCVVLVTSRDALPTLVSLHGACRIDLDPLPSMEALSLLRRLVGPRVDADPDAAAVLAEQCARLPLVIRITAEIALARPATTLPELVTDLADHRHRLTRLSVGDDPHAAVADVFSWSLRQLPPAVARTFALLGLHPGPEFDAYAAAAVTGVDLVRVSGHLDQLVGINLVHSTDPARYAMHDLLRAYALTLATTGRASDDHPEVGRLFDYYLAAAGAAMDLLHPADVHARPPAPTPTPAVPPLPDRESASAWLETELPNLSAMAVQTAAAGWPSRIVRLSMTLFRFLDGGYHSAALTIHGHARDAARRSDDPAGEGHALLGLGSAHWQTGRHEAAAGLFEQAASLFRRTADHIGLARALGNLSGVEGYLGRLDAAVEHCTQAVAMLRRVGNRTGEADALVFLGSINLRAGRDGPAGECYKQALALFQQTGHRVGEAKALSALGQLSIKLAAYELATEQERKALALFRELGDPTGEAWSLTFLANALTRLGRPAEATRHHERAVTLFRQAGDPNGEAAALNGLGEAAHAAGDPDLARTHHTAALGKAVEAAASSQQFRAHAGLGHAYRATGDAARAREHYKLALSLNIIHVLPDPAEIHAALRDLDGT